MAVYTCTMHWHTASGKYITFWEYQLSHTYVYICTCNNQSVYTKNVCNWLTVCSQLIQEPTVPHCLLRWCMIASILCMLCSLSILTKITDCWMYCIHGYTHGSTRQALSKSPTQWWDQCWGHWHLEALRPLKEKGGKENKRMRSVPCRRPFIIVC